MIDAWGDYFPWRRPLASVHMCEATYYREKAVRFREMVKDSDAITASALVDLAEAYEDEARRLERDIEPPMPPES